MKIIYYYISVLGMMIYIASDLFRLVAEIRMIQARHVGLTKKIRSTWLRRSFGT